MTSYKKQNAEMRVDVRKTSGDKMWHQLRLLLWFLPGNEGMILSFLSISPDSMGNISFSDFCHQNIKHFWARSSKHYILFGFDFTCSWLWIRSDWCCFHLVSRAFYFVVRRNSHGGCGSQDTSCRSASQRGRSISPSACTPAHTDQYNKPLYCT